MPPSEKAGGSDGIMKTQNPGHSGRGFAVNGREAGIRTPDLLSPRQTR